MKNYADWLPTQVTTQMKGWALFAITILLICLANSPLQASPLLVDISTFDEEIVALTFYDANHGYAVNPEKHNLFETTDGGKTWKSEFIDVHVFTQISDLRVVGKSGLLFGNDQGYIWYRSHPDSAWTVVRQGLGKKINELEVFGEQSWGATTDSIVMITTDGGKTYSTWSPTKKWQSIQSIDITNESLMHIGMRQYIVYRSTDGGKSWNELHAETTPFGDIKDVRFLNQNVGFVASLYPWNLFTTLDGGKTWSAGPYEYPSSIAATKSGTAAYTANGYMRTSNDGGINWNDSLALPYIKLNGQASYQQKRKVVTAGDNTMFVLLSARNDTDGSAKSLIARIGSVTSVEDAETDAAKFLDLD